MCENQLCGGASFARRAAKGPCFREFSFKNMHFLGRGGPPGAEVPCFHAPSDTALRQGETHGFSGVFGGQKTPVFHGPRAQPPKNHVFLRSNSTPPRGPLSGGRCGTGVRDTTRKRQFPAQKLGFTTAPSPPRGENPVFSRPLPPPPAPPGPAEGRSGRYARGILHFRPKSIVFYCASWPAPNPARAQVRSTGKTREFRPEHAKSNVFFLARPPPEKRVGLGP